MLAFVRLSSISFTISGIIAVVKCAKTFYRPGHNGLLPVIFRTAGPALPLLL